MAENLRAAGCEVAQLAGIFRAVLCNPSQVAVIGRAPHGQTARRSGRRDRGIGWEWIELPREGGTWRERGTSLSESLCAGQN